MPYAWTKSQVFRAHWNTRQGGGCLNLGGNLISVGRHYYRKGVLPKSKQIVLFNWRKLEHPNSARSVQLSRYYGRLVIPQVLHNPYTRYGFIGNDQHFESHLEVNLTSAAHEGELFGCTRSFLILQIILDLQPLYGQFFNHFMVIIKQIIQWLKSILPNGHFLLETSKKGTNCDHVTADTATNGKCEPVARWQNHKRDHRYMCGVCNILWRLKMLYGL